MQVRSLVIILVFTIADLTFGASKPVVKDLGTIRVEIPAGWKSVTPSSPMRKAQFALPKAKGDKEDAELVVFNFGPSQGGGVQANLDRWYGQFQQPGGRSTKETAKQKQKKVAGMNITIVDVNGTYVAPRQVGNPAAGSFNEPNYRMLAAIVEAKDSSYFFKLVGPAKTVGHWAKSFDAFVASVKKT